MSLNLYKVYVPFYVEAEVEVVAENKEEAKSIARRICRGEEYANDTVGVNVKYVNPEYPDYYNELRNLTIGEPEYPEEVDKLEEVYDDEYEEDEYEEAE